MNTTAKYTAKDSVFTDLFGNPKYLFELYKTLHPEDTQATADSIEIITIENVLVNGIHNDLGFTVGDRLIVLVECQSTWTDNILIRILLYYAETFHKHIIKTGQDYFRSKKVRLPKPEAYIIFTGERGDKPERLVLSQEFFDGQEIDIEVKAKVIYQTDGDDIINQYIVFCKVLDRQIKIHGYTKEAVEETIKICRDKNILCEYLETRKSEVITMLESLFKEETIREMHENSIRMEAKADGRKEGAEFTAKRMLARGDIQLNDIADLTGLTVSEIEKLREKIN